MVYQYNSIESLRWELPRNGQLRFMCGFNSQKDVPRANNIQDFSKSF
ncbi:hypothetical protein [Thermoanaerobacterium thermosaccharolyticum]